MALRSIRQLRRLANRALAALPWPAKPHRPSSTRDDAGYLARHMGWFIRRRMRQSGTPGLSVALVSESQVLWTAGFGDADLSSRRPASPDTVYQVGSITKVVTAIAAMQRIERGEFSLDTPINELLPEFSMRTRWPEASPITVRSLLSHHAGLPTYLLKGFFSDQSLESLLAELRHEHLAYEPNTVFNYSNLGPNLLGLVLQRRSGLNYAELIARDLLRPLGMANSGFSPTGSLARQLATGYIDGEPVTPTPIRDVPAGGLYSSVRDLGRFVQMVLAGGQLGGIRLLGESALEESLTPQFANCALDFGQQFGLGWMLSGLPLGLEGRQAWHNGGTKAFLSQMALLPDQRLGVVVLANADSAGNLVYETAEELLRLAAEVFRGLRPQPPTRAPEQPQPRSGLERHVGDYSLMGSLARISLGRKRLRLHVLNHTLDLVPVTSNRYRVEYNLLGLKSVPIAFPEIEFLGVDNRDFAVLRDRVAIPAERVPTYGIPDSWRRYTGNQRLLNPDPEYLVDLEHCRMEIRQGRLLMDIRLAGIEKRKVKVVVVPFSDHEAYVFGLGRNVGDVARTYEIQGSLRTRFSGYEFELEQPRRA